MEDNTLVPAREVFEALGATVEWNPENNMEVYVVYNHKSIAVYIGQTRALVGGEEKEMNIPPRIINGSESIVNGCICIENRDAIYNNTRSSIIDSLSNKGERTLVHFQYPFNSPDIRDSGLFSNIKVTLFKINFLTRNIFKDH